MPPKPEFKLISPLDAGGLDFGRPLDQVLWHKLTNVWFNAGFVETRPALRPVGPLSQDISSRGAGIITAIGECVNWSLEDTSVGVQERLAVNGSSGIVNWTAVGAATVHAAMDETVPDDDTTYAQALVTAARMTLSFANLVNTPDLIDDVVLHLRAKATLPIRQQLDIYYGSQVDAAFLVDSIYIANTDYADDEDGTVHGGYVDYYIPITTDVVGGGWYTDLVNAAQVVIVATQDATAPATVWCLSNTTGSDDDFTPAGSGWQSNSGVPVFYSADRSTIVDGEIGDRISVIFDGTGTPMTTITQITANFSVARRGVNGASVSIYFKSGGTRYTVASNFGVVRRYDTSIWDIDWGWTNAFVTMTTNPATGLAWTSAEVEAGLEFGIEVDDYGEGLVVFTDADLMVEGLVANQGARITQAELIVSERTTGSTQQQLFGRVMATTTAFQRLDLQSAHAGSDLVDILGAVAAPTSGWSNWSIAEFFNQLYFGNSVDDVYVYAGSDGTMSALAAGKPVGHTMWSFAQRLFQGDITSGGTRYPKRIAWSGLADATDWTGSTAGDLDLTHGGQGRVRLGIPLSAEVSAVFLDRGIYTLRWTGDDDAPFVPRLMDSDTGIVAPRTARPILDHDGSAVLFFLGRGPKGVDVYAFDGTGAQSVGGEIMLELQRLANPANLSYSFAGVDIENNLYLLFVPEGDQVFPEQCWVYHLDSGHWTRWEFPFGITAVGEWTLVEGEGDPFAFGDARDGVRTLILGATLGIPYRFDYDAASDWVSVPGPEDHRSAFWTSSDGLTNPTAPRELPIDITLETGSFVLGDEDIRRLTSLERVWLTYEDRGQAALTLTISRDGGQSSENSTDFQLGNEGVTEGMAADPPRLREAIVNVAEPTAGRHHSIKIVNDQDENHARQRVKISKLMLEYQQLGDT